MLEVIVPDRVWGAEHDLYMPGGVHFRGRMTVVRLASGGLWLHSPVPVDDALAAELAALGPVEHLVAPSRLHHLHVGPAQERYPHALAWAAPGLPEKRRDLRFDGVLPDGVPWASEIEPLLVEGIPWMNEVVFLHRASRTLVVTDLFFHIHEVANLRSRVLFTLYGVLGRPMQSPVVWVMTRDRAAAGRSARRILGWDVERAVPAHGRVLHDDAHAVLERVLARMARGAPAALGASGATG